MTILDAHKWAAWGALSGGYNLETVEDCIVETQTGFQRRRPEENIDEAQLRKDFKAIHPVTEIQRANVLLNADGIALDIGEQALWAHALTRTDAWVLCGPDKASLRFGVRMKCRDRMISLERLLVGVGFNPKKLDEKHTSKWLERVLGEFVIEELMKKS